MTAPAIALLVFRFKALAPAKWYPVIVSGGFLCFFAASFAVPPVIIFRFALLMDKTIKGSLKEKLVERYCKKVTAAWCCFFALNGSAAAWTVLAAPTKIWLIYNGCISYILMGILFLGEFMIRQTVDNQMPKEIPFSRFAPDSRPMEKILCFDGAFAENKHKTWRDFLRDTALLRETLGPLPQIKWLLRAEDYWHFLTAFVALFQCGKQVLLTANMTAENVAEIAGGESIGILTDKSFPNSLQIADIVSDGKKAPDGFESARAPFNPVESVFVVYTSGSTGKPKGIPHRIIEFEANIGFPPSWVEAWLARKNIVTTDQHHIYGLVFGIILPFTLGIPFRRKRIELPQEFEALGDSQYMLITTPAFLKRTTEAGIKPKMKSPWIIASGGFLPEETAKKTEELLGFWPIDIYGSTEGSGIAHRRSKDGPEWTPFGSIKVSANEAGCLVIHLPFPNVPPIPTGDLVDVFPDGRFTLKGRADSIVKIEEKRVSLTEVEGRIMESGMAKDACVIALEDKRQYLAAVIALADEAKAKFAGKEKLDINKFWTEQLAKHFEPTVIPKKWRYVDAIPQDAQGKKQRDQIEALFAGESDA